MDNATFFQKNMEYYNIIYKAGICILAETGIKPLFKLAKIVHAT